MSRIVVFTSDLNYTVRKGIVDLCNHTPGLEILVLVHKPPRKPGRLIRNQWRNLKRNGWRWIPYQLGEILRLLFSRLRRKQWHSISRPGAAYSGDAFEAVPGICVATFDNIHQAAALVLTTKFAPDLGVSLAAPILKPALFEIPRLGTINLHKGKLPDYRGMPPAFWELWNDEQSVGCTIHEMAKGLDTGGVLLTDSLDRMPWSTPHGMRLVLDEIGSRLTCDAVARVMAGTLKSTPQAEGGKTYRKPTLAQVARLGRKLDGTGGIAPREIVKAFVSTGYVHVARPPIRLINRLAGRREIVILLYHRVSDEFRDGVTVGIEQFDRQMAYIAERYPVASVDDIVKNTLPETTLGKPIVAVTFDDGYRDNFDHAVPILVRHGIPAAFFVSTGKMDSESGFDHDLGKLGRALPNMSWDQLREMRDLGFTIGSHTVSHLNCAKASAQQVRDELASSRDQLRDELGLEEIDFAYPFGGRQDMTAEALELVKEAGYRACFSAYGGVNRGKVNPFNILRFGIACNFRFSRFTARLEGW